MQCLSKKREITIEGMDSCKTGKDVDVVLTTREVDRLLKAFYIKPEMEIIETGVQSQLLAGSSDPWWKEPDPPEEGCESSWHCGGWGD